MERLQLAQYIRSGYINQLLDRLTGQINRSQNSRGGGGAGDSLDAALQTVGRVKDLLRDLIL